VFLEVQYFQWVLDYLGYLEYPVFLGYLGYPEYLVFLEVQYFQ
jgi:hypothetical protein